MSTENNDHNPTGKYTEQAKAIREARVVERGLSVPDAAKLFDVTPQCWYQWERGLVLPSEPSKLAKFLKCDVALLVR